MAFVSFTLLAWGWAFDPERIRSRATQPQASAGHRHQRLRQQLAPRQAHQVHVDKLARRQVQVLAQQPSPQPGTQRVVRPSLSRYTCDHSQWVNPARRKAKS